GSLVFPGWRGREAERALVFRVVPSQPLDGLILIIPPGGLQYIGELSKHGLPVVLIDDRIEHRDYDFPSVGTTNVQGAFEATRHLLRLGRRRIAIVTGPMDVGRRRLAGYRQALEEADVPFQEELVMPGDFYPESGLAAGTRLVGSRVPFDAVFGSNREMAFGQ